MFWINKLLIRGELVECQCLRIRLQINPHILCDIVATSNKHSQNPTASTKGKIMHKNVYIAPMLSAIEQLKTKLKQHQETKGCENVPGSILKDSMPSMSPKAAPSIASTLETS